MPCTLEIVFFSFYRDSDGHCDGDKSDGEKSCECHVCTAPLNSVKIVIYANMGQLYTPIRDSYTFTPIRDSYMYIYDDFDSSTIHA